jgi:DNA-binding NarL/FixJ family response regulator
MFDDLNRADEPLSVAIIAAYPAVRAGLRALLSGQPDIVVSAVWSDDAWDDAAQPSVVLLDCDPDDAELPERVSARFPDSALALLLDAPGDFVAPPAGQPVAALLKDAGQDELLAALRAVAQGLIVLDPAIAAQLAPAASPLTRPALDGDERLTEREAQVLELLALGLPNKSIAMELGISEHTAKFHVGSIMAKLGAASRTEAVALAARRGLLVL